MPGPRGDRRNADFIAFPRDRSEVCVSGAAPHGSRRAVRTRGHDASSTLRRALGNARERTFLALSAAALVATGSANAFGEPLPNNDFAIDLFQGPILAPIRVIGIAGAYAGYAEGIAGFVANAASPALREPFSVNHTELDVAASLSIPISLFDNSDFDNSGGLDYDYSNFIYLTGGVLFQHGRLGLGAYGELSRYTLTDQDGEEVNLLIGKYHALGAVRLLGGQLMVGGGARIVSMGIDAPEAELTFAGLGPEVGVIVRPDWESFRIGATFRAPVYAGHELGDVQRVDGGVERAGGLVLPDNVVLPWEIEVGVAVQVGPRPLNPEWIDPVEQEADLLDTLTKTRQRRARDQKQELSVIADPVLRAETQRTIAAQETIVRAEEDRVRERAEGRLKDERRARYGNWPREHLLVTAEILVTGDVDRGVSLQRFLGQNQPRDPRRTGFLGPRDHDSLVGTSGASVSFSPRFGIETEPIPMLVHTRFGSYYEPSRFDRIGRQHFTFGSDMRVLTTTWFGLVPEVTYTLQGSIDLAPRYESYSVGIGVWH